MNIEKNKGKYLGRHWFYYYYVDSKTGDWIYHGLLCGTSSSVGYFYHNDFKGFWFINKYKL